MPLEPRWTPGAAGYSPSAGKSTSSAGRSSSRAGSAPSSGQSSLAEDGFSPDGSRASAFPTPVPPSGVIKTETMRGDILKETGLSGKKGKIKFVMQQLLTQTRAQALGAEQIRALHQVLEFLKTQTKDSIDANVPNQVDTSRDILMKNIETNFPGGSDGGLVDMIRRYTPDE